MKDMEFYAGKRVLITGHTGFKGTWLCKLLAEAGAIVTGYALQPNKNESLFSLCNMTQDIHSIIGDIRDLSGLEAVFQKERPEIVIHMAAQPLVYDSYLNPVYTYDVNVMGTVNILECVRKSQSVQSFLNVTTDKVYLNKEWEWGYRENEELNGYDPYSNSKSCSELVTSSYKQSFFTNSAVAISTARAGNVIGGGDFAANRIIPDCVRAIEHNEQIIVRNPYSVRPYQHVLEPLWAYLMICKAQYNNSGYADSYNVGPNEEDCLTTGELVTLLCRKWNECTGANISWVDKFEGGPHEANDLKLDCSKIKNKLQWNPRWGIETAIDKIVDWTRVYMEQGDMKGCMEKQIHEYLQ